jgi:hypothetical protein
MERIRYGNGDGIGLAPPPSLVVVPSELPPVAASPVPKPAPPDPPVVAALRCVAEKHPDQAFELLRNYDRSTQEILGALLPLAARLGEEGMEHVSPQELTVVLDHLNDLMAALRARAPLELKKIFFCRRINGFGDYDALQPNPEFHGGLDGRPGERVRVYAEVRNFRSVPKGNIYETQLGCTLKIFSFDNHEKPVCEPIELRAEPSRSHTQRQDYFINVQFNLPHLPQGYYTLRVDVRDETALEGEKVAPRAASRTLDFHVRPGSLSRASGSE